MSGGPDSLALLLLAHAALPGRVVAATIDHGLRAESADEAAMVGRLCERLGISHDTVSVTLEPGNVQDRARKARYQALCRSFGACGAGTFATAHHADDQAETVLMRLNRGSGVAGLAGIRTRRVVISDDPLGEFLLVRPLLRWRREELEAIVAAVGIEPARDPSNDDDRYDRARVRHVLAELPWIDPVAVARSAEHLQDAEATVRDAVAAVHARCIFRDGAATWFYRGHAPLVELEIVLSILQDYGARVSRSEAAQMVEQLRREHHATLGGVAARRDWHRKDRLTQVDAWRFEPEPPRRSG